VNVRCIKDVILETEDKDDMDKGIRYFTFRKIYPVDQYTKGYLTIDDTGKEHFLSDNQDTEDKNDKAWFNEYFELV